LIEPSSSEKLLQKEDSDALDYSILFYSILFYAHIYVEGYTFYRIPHNECTLAKYL